ncbi:unnamed protein product [Chrysoparadoxa australica]
MSKAAKFTMVDPLGEDELSVQQAVQQNVDDRMGKAVEELQEKYATGGRGFDAANDNQPTGSAYKEARAEKRKQAAQLKAQKRSVQEAEEAELAAQLEAQRLEEDSDDEYLDGLDNDPELEKIREARLKQLKASHDTKLANLGKGHGQYREVVQDEFLPEVTGSERVVCHFYHNDFEKCKIMDMHMQRLAQGHVETKFIKINAEKTPFFVQKLQIKVLPCLCIFIDGINTEQVLGFEGLNENMPPGKENEWPTANLSRRLALAKAVNYTAQDLLKEKRSEYNNNIRSSTMVEYGDEDSD